MTGVQSTRRTPLATTPETNTTYTFRLETAPADTEQWPASWNKVREPLANILLSK
jgi:hypothetical protein